MRIDILCPSRGRPDLALRMVKSVKDTAVHGARVRVHLYVNDDDAELNRYHAMLEPYRSLVVIHQGPDAPTAWSWNELAAKGDGDLLMLAGDDCIFVTRGWDNAFETAWTAMPNGIGLLSFNDGRSLPGTGHPHPVMSRAMYEALGYFTPPLFFHWCVDVWLVTLAKRAGVFTYLADVTVDHVKPAETTGVDDTHRRIRKGIWHKRDHQSFQQAGRWLDQDVELIELLAKRTQCPCKTACRGCGKEEGILHG
jgi:hypothetical protein